MFDQTYAENVTRHLSYPFPWKIKNWSKQMLFAVAVMTGSSIVNGRQPDEASADLVLVGGVIWSGVDETKQAVDLRLKPTALAIRKGRIVAMGSDGQIRGHVGLSTRLIDVKGRRIIPGITDSHIHLVSGGLQLGRLSLRDVRNKEEFVRAVEIAASSKKRGEWIQGGRWSVESWESVESPTREWIDPVTRDNPVFLSRMDGHQALVNSAALRLAGISAVGPKDPAGGEIERDPQTGEPTGILKESAMDFVQDGIPPASFDDRYAALRRVMAHANSYGITSVHDMTEPSDWDIFRHAHKEGTLTLRITSYLSVSDWHGSIRKVKGFPTDDDMLRVAGFKGYMDGALGSRTAYLREPYSDAESDMRYPRGQLTEFAADRERFQKQLEEADGEGLQLAVHAIGDEANHLLLDAYEAAGDQHKDRDRRHRIEHAQHLRVEDIPRIAKLGVVASMQPFHKADDGRYAEKRLGAERLKGSYAFRQLVDAGVMLAFGSDFPVVTLDPFAGIDAAVNSKTLAGDVWLPGHALTVTEAVRAYTVTPAKAVHREDRLGTLEVGKLADLVVLDADPFAIPVEQVGAVKTWMTIVGGRIVHASETP